MLVSSKYERNQNSSLKKEGKGCLVTVFEGLQAFFSLIVFFLNCLRRSSRNPDVPVKRIC